MDIIGVQGLQCFATPAAALSGSARRVFRLCPHRFRLFSPAFPTPRLSALRIQNLFVEGS